MKCGNCGSDNPDDSIHCVVCGKLIGDEQETVASYAGIPFGSVVACPKCGARNSRTDRWCGSCDADLEEAKKRIAQPSQRGPDCPKCGISSLAGTRYCRKCGGSLMSEAVDSGHSWGLTVGGGDVGLEIGLPFSSPQREIVRERQVIMIRCKYCGTLNGPNEKNCTSCGAQM